MSAIAFFLYLRRLGDRGRPHFIPAGRPHVLIPLRRRMLSIMQQILATCIAIAVLWVVDVEFKDGRYSAVVKQAFSSMIA